MKERDRQLKRDGSGKERHTGEERWAVEERDGQWKRDRQWKRETGIAVGSCIAMALSHTGVGQGEAWLLCGHLGCQCCPGSWKEMERRRRSL